MRQFLPAFVLLVVCTAEAPIALADCAPCNPGTWQEPGEAVDLLLTHGGGSSGTTTLAWSPPALPGSIELLYDTLVADDAADFVGAASCLESDDGDTVATDRTTPPQGQVRFYLVRADGGCGEGPLGTSSAGDEREGRGCPTAFDCEFDPPVELAEVPTGPGLDEASGLAQSRRDPQILWSHNDDADDERLFAVRIDGTYLGSWDLDVATAVDPEDLAIGPGPDPEEPYLYVGDIGGDGSDNTRIWGCKVAGSNNPADGCGECPDDDDCQERTLLVWRLPEPMVDPGQEFVEVIDHPAETLEFAFPDSMLGQFQNVETLMIDPWTRDLYFVTKATTPFRVFRAPFPQLVGAVNVLEHVADLPGFEGEATGGDISADGTLIVIRTLDAWRIWQRPGGTTVWDALATPHCVACGPSEPKGESVAFDVDNSGSFFTLSERQGGPQKVPLYYVQRVF